MGNMEAIYSQRLTINATGVDAIVRLGLRQSKALATYVYIRIRMYAHKMKNRALNKWPSLNVKHE